MATTEYLQFRNNVGKFDDNTSPLLIIDAIRNKHVGNSLDTSDMASSIALAIEEDDSLGNRGPSVIYLNKYGTPKTPTDHILEELKKYRQLAGIEENFFEPNKQGHYQKLLDSFGIAALQIEPPNKNDKFLPGWIINIRYLPELNDEGRPIFEIPPITNFMSGAFSTEEAMAKCLDFLITTGHLENKGLYPHLMPWQK